MNALSRTTIRMTVAAAALLMLGACASTMEQGSTVQAAPATVANKTEFTQDHEYMAQVESIARRRNIGVTWVNPPTKRHRLPREGF